MNLQDIFAMLAGAAVVFLGIFIAIVIKNIKVLKKPKISATTADDKTALKNKNIVITNLNLKENNSWDNPQIQLWLSNPLGYGRRDADEKLPLEGKVINPPKEGFVRIFIMLAPKNFWKQGDFVLNNRGEWKAMIYLASGPDEKYKKTIRIELYEPASVISNS